MDGVSILCDTEFWFATGFGVNCVCISADGLFVVSAGCDQHIKVWDVKKGSVQTLSGHSGWVCVVSGASSQASGIALQEVRSL
eukprot:gene18509-biopygen5463